ncbi:potassium-transporting ATPase subunit KdpC [Paenibacillus sp. JX-17]|uniref:Potassium-transporting ATPase KdpC subunit n=1 Tax=Paenibacillus lacisoli TaxID=3064525 RepID=A0ABT9CG12_9BACL|nr:potassium-transporting ATPase subunit KdpC [Paenibacillus sp. JX-17]MDO7908219.1 potassium-transporting ATPase subunit KdpC [Paenibacillus sp. JX-17]
MLMRYVMSSLRISLLMMIVLGLGYNLLVTGFAQTVMPERANGSLILNDQAEVVGSRLIGQENRDQAFFQNRVSSIEYNGASGSPNYAPSNPDMLKRTSDAVKEWHTQNPDVQIGSLPLDLITNSGSGLDPHISPAAAEVQIPRISKLTGISPSKLKLLVNKHTEGRELGFLGEPAVNVLELNLELKSLMPE